MDKYDWVPSLFTWNYHNIVNQLYANTKEKFLKTWILTQKCWLSMAYQEVSLLCLHCPRYLSSLFLTTSLLSAILCLEILFQPAFGLPWQGGGRKAFGASQPGRGTLENKNVERIFSVGCCLMVDVSLLTSLTEHSVEAVEARSLNHWTIREVCGLTALVQWRKHSRMQKSEAAELFLQRQ